tara:strand:- start:1296 stop:2486 length:1191 start_codon:yes stop_codon:yes gene_type:complete
MKEKKKIIIIVSSPFYLKDYNRFGIEKFLKNGYEIEICNTCPIIYPVFFKKAQRANLYRGKIEKIFFNKKKLKNYLDLNKKNIFILIIHYNIKTHFIFKLITKLDINYLFSLVNVVPSNIEANKNINYKKILSLKALARIFSNRIIGFLKRYFQKIKSPNYLLAGGLKSLKSPQASIINNSTKIIWTHTYDFDEYLLNNKKKDNDIIHAIKNNFAVFIDAPSPLIKHDALIPGISSPLTANVYFPSLCKFFDKIEKRLNIEVVIAAHPRSNHLNRPEYFGKRRVFKHMTIDLIKKCKLVINRNSTAINFAVLYSKPIIFHTSKQISNHFSMTHQIYSMANLLDKVPINIDALENIDWNNQLNINKKLYVNYSNQYIKNPKSKNKYLWDIVIREIND